MSPATSRRRSAARAARGTAGEPPADLPARWAHLHRADREPLPTPAVLAQLSRHHPPFARWLEAQGDAAAVARELLSAWESFHAGDFLHAVELGVGLGALGAIVANKAAAVYSLYPTSSRGVPRLLEQAAARGEAAVEQLPDYANAHFTLALVLGRYSQRISILRALTEGLATRVRTHLERALELEPRHAEAHVALGLYHAEVVAQLGGLAARLTYGANADAARRHFERAVELTPDSPIAWMEYAHALQRLDGRAPGARIRELYRRAAACTPADAMERLDRERARRELGSLGAE